MASKLSLEQALRTLGELLEQRGLHYELYVVGGGALQLLGLITRATSDIDVVGLVERGYLVRAEPLPPPLAAAIADTATVLGLPATWLNAGPTSLLDLGLPVGALTRTTGRQWGGLTLRLAARTDQIAFKLYAAVDQGPDSKHFADLQALAPTRAELLHAARWARTHDPSDAFREELRHALRDLGVANAEI